MSISIPYRRFCGHQMDGVVRVIDQAVLEAYGLGDLKELPHSCLVRESTADATNEAVSSSAPLSLLLQKCRDSLLICGDERYD